jgi:hypothetical protein
MSRARVPDPSCPAKGSAWCRAAADGYRLRSAAAITLLKEVIFRARFSKEKTRGAADKCAR